MYELICLITVCGAGLVYLAGVNRKTKRSPVASEKQKEDLAKILARIKKQGEDKAHDEADKE